MHKNFIPASHYECLLPLYDISARVFFHRSQNRLAETVRKQNPKTVVDAACGPGRVLLKIRKVLPAAKLIGVDIDPKILSIARKVTHGHSIQLIESSITKIPLPSDSVDVVFSSLAFHHLAKEQKQEAFQEIQRILHPKGIFLLYDIDFPKKFIGKIIYFLIHTFEHIEKQSLHEQLSVAEFFEVQKLATDYGIVSLYCAKKVE